MNNNPILDFAIKALSFPGHKPEIKGTAADPDIKYYGDIDLYTFIKKRSYLDYQHKIHGDFMNIFNRIRKSKNLYFLEFKAGFDLHSDNPKVRWTMDELQKGFKVLPNGKRYDFYRILEHPYSVVKIDVAYWNKETSLFTEISNIYDFHFNGDIPKTKEQMREEIEAEMFDFYEQGNYWKALRRLYSIAKFDNNTVLTKKLIDVFNGDDGLLAYVKAHLETLLRVQDLVSTTRVKQSFNALKQLSPIPIDINNRLTKKKLQQQYNKLSKVLNKRVYPIAKEFLNND